MKYKKFSKKYANLNWPIKNIGHFWRDFPFKNWTILLEQRFYCLRAVADNN